MLVPCSLRHNRSFPHFQRQTDHTIKRAMQQHRSRGPSIGIVVDVYSFNPAMKYLLRAALKFSFTVRCPSRDISSFTKITLLITHTFTKREVDSFANACKQSL